MTSSVLLFLVIVATFFFHCEGYTSPSGLSRIATFNNLQSVFQQQSLGTESRVMMTATESDQIQLGRVTMYKKEGSWFKTFSSLQMFSCDPIYVELVLETIRWPYTRVSQMRAVPCCDSRNDQMFWILEILRFSFIFLMLFEVRNTLRSILTLSERRGVVETIYKLRQLTDAVLNRSWIDAIIGISEFEEYCDNEFKIFPSAYR